MTVTERWILPWSHFNFTKGAAPATAKAARWWLMGAIHFQTKCKQGGILQTQVRPEMTAGLNSCTSSLEYVAFYLVLSCFCRWEQYYVSLGGSFCLHTELRNWLNSKLFTEEGSCLHFIFRYTHQASQVTCTLAFKQTGGGQGWLDGNEGLFILYVQLQPWSSAGFLPSLMSSSWEPSRLTDDKGWLENTGHSRVPSPPRWCCRGLPCEFSADELSVFIRNTAAYETGRAATAPANSGEILTHSVEQFYVGEMVFSAIVWRRK